MSVSPLRPEAETAAPARLTPTWTYALGMFGTSIPINMITGTMVLYYVNILGLDVTTYGIVMAFYAVVEAIDTPLLGYLSDRTRTPLGRRRPWLIVAGPLLAACMIGFFSAPYGLAGTGLVVWFATFAILSEAFNAIINANYSALLPELFPVERRRAVANSARQAFQLLALVVSLALTPLLTTKVFGTAKTTGGFTITAILYAIVATAVILFMAVTARENPRHSAPERPPLWRTIATILRNPFFWKIGLTGACYTVSMTFVLAGVQLYVIYSLGLAAWYATILEGVVIVLTVGFLFVWMAVVRRKGAAWTWRLAFAVLAVSFIGLFFATSLITAILAGALVGVGYAGMLATNDLITSRVVDHDGAVHGAHREGLYFSAFGFFGRFNGLISGLALGSLAVFFGFHSGQHTGPQPGLAFRVYVGAYPFAIALIGAVAARLVRVPRIAPAPV